MNENELLNNGWSREPNGYYTHPDLPGEFLTGHQALEAQEAFDKLVALRAGEHSYLTNITQGE